MSELLYKYIFSRWFIWRSDFNIINSRLKEKQSEINKAANLLNALIQEQANEEEKDKLWIVLQTLGYIRIRKPKRFNPQAIEMTPTDDELIAKARSLGWGYLCYASGPSTHPMCVGSRDVDTGPRQGDELLQGSPPGYWVLEEDGTGIADLLDLEEGLSMTSEEIKARLD